MTRTRSRRSSPKFRSGTPERFCARTGLRGPELPGKVLKSQQFLNILKSRNCPRIHKGLDLLRMKAAVAAKKLLTRSEAEGPVTGRHDRLFLQRAFRRPSPCLPQSRSGVSAHGGRGLSVPGVQPEVRAVRADNPRHRRAGARRRTGFACVMRNGLCRDLSARQGGSARARRARPYRRPSCGRADERRGDDGRLTGRFTRRSVSPFQARSCRDRRRAFAHRAGCRSARSARAASPESRCGLPRPRRDPRTGSWSPGR